MIRWPGLAAVLLGGVLAAPAAAQTRFEWPDTTVRVATYTNPEECLAAAARVWSGMARRDSRTVWRDTMPRDPRETLEAAPEAVTETAARCAARFPEATASLDDFAPLLALYLAAGRDADAAALLTRRMAAVPAKSAREQAAVGDSAVDIYLNARPVRLEPAERILVARARSASDRVARLALYDRLMKAAETAGDTARARRAARWVVAVADSLTKTERESEAFDELAGGNGGKLLVYDAMQVLVGTQVMLDSLRSGTAALAALERGMWSQITGERPDALPLPIGVRAPTVTADYWFPSSASAVPHPTPGHVSILLLVNQRGCLHVDPFGDVGDQCTILLSALRRLSARFPAVEITIVGQTSGAFVYAKPPTPAEEADLVRQWLAPYRIPGAVLAVNATPHWNLPQPDGRRIDKQTPTQIAYSFGKSWKPSGAFLVDQDGLIASALSFNEADIAQFIEVLLHRQTTGADHAAK